VAVVANIAFSLALMGPLGAPGLALATALAAMVNGGILVVMLTRRLGGVDWRSIGRSSLRSVIACMPLIGICLWVAESPAWNTPGDWTVKSAMLGLAVAISISGYAGVQAMVGSEEFHIVWEMAQRKLGRLLKR
jgi:putative peptidoglycan lipid II flippase